MYIHTSTYVYMYMYVYVYINYIFHYQIIIRGTPVLPDKVHKNRNARKHIHWFCFHRVYNNFPTINVNGNLQYLRLQPRELREYESQVEHVLYRYLRRLQWMLAGSRRVFSTVVEKKCVFLIDTSGSMDPSMEELKKELASLIWDQLHKQKVR